MRHSTMLLILLFLLMPGQAGTQSQSNDAPPVITSDNIPGLTEISTMGYGYLGGLAYTPDGEQLIVSAGAGLFLFDGDTLTDEPDYIPYDHYGKITITGENTFAVQTETGSIDLWTLKPTEIIDSIPADAVILPNYNAADNTFITQPGSRFEVYAADTGRYIGAVSLPYDEDKLPPAPEERDEGFIPYYGYSPDGNWFYETLSRKVYLYDLIAQKSYTRTAYGSSPLVVFSPDGESLIIQTDLWELSVFSTTSSLDVIQTINTPSGIKNIAFHPDGDRIAINGTNGEMIIWNIETNEPVTDARQGFGIRVAQMALSEDEDTLTIVSRLGQAQQWNLTTEQPISTIEIIGQIIDRADPERRRMPRGFSMTFDGELIANGITNPPTILLWTPEGETQNPVTLDNASDTRHMVLSPDGDYIVFENRSRLRVLSVAEFEQRVDIPFEGDISELRIMPSGDRLFALFDDGSIRIYDLLSGEELTAITGKWSNPHTITISDDGQRMAINYRCLNCTVEEERSIYIFDLESGEIINTLSGNDSSVPRVIFNPSGTLLISITFPLARVWDVNTGEMLLTLSDDVLQSATFNAAGTRLFTANDNGTISIWQVTEAD